MACHTHSMLVYQHALGTRRTPENVDNSLVYSLTFLGQCLKNHVIETHDMHFVRDGQHEDEELTLHLLFFWLIFVMPNVATLTGVL